MNRIAMTVRTTAAAIAALIVLLSATSFLRAADEKAAGEELFNGKDFSGWKMDNPRQAEVWKIVSSAELDPKDSANLATRGDGSEGHGLMFRVKHEEGYGANPYTEKTFADCEVHVEFMTPNHSNSGVYLMGQYEVQIYTDIGTPDNKLGLHNTGAIYITSKPSTISLKPYGQWNTMDIVFQAPRFESGKKVKNAKFISVIINGVKVQENVDTPKPTGGQLPGGEKPRGPLMLQGDHGCVAFRSVRVKQIESSK
jgi:3-keto-disaccharide hydrolase